MIPIKDENPRLRVPVVTVTLIVINVLVYLYETQLGPGLVQFFYKYGVVPSAVVQGQGFGSLLTSMFVHGGFFHLAGNMLYLWIFGDNVEGYLGHFQFVIFYLVCGIVAALSHIFIGGISDTPMVGASGAISGVLGAYFVKYPRARVLVVIPIFWFIDIRAIPAVFVLGFWFVMQLFSGMFTVNFQGGGVAFWAHVGGFLAGMFLVNFLPRKRIGV